jgi:hypothetical protein
MDITSDIQLYSAVMNQSIATSTTRVSGGETLTTSPVAGHPLPTQVSGGGNPSSRYFTIGQSAIGGSDRIP